MKHITICNAGTHIGIEHELLLIKEQKKPLVQYPLNRVRTISIAKKGVSVSSNLIISCAQRGIKVFYHNYTGRTVAVLSGSGLHADSRARVNQILFLQDVLKKGMLSQKIALGKIKNQRAVLLYFRKQSSSDETIKTLGQAAEKLKQTTTHLFDKKTNITDRDILMGIEGSCGRVYWDALRRAKLLPKSFSSREGRGSSEVTNSCLNYAYAILESYVQSTLLNAGLEIFEGFYHVPRPGKPSLVLDLMEEYRAWVCDRNIIKMRFELGKIDAMSTAIKRRVISSVNQTFDKRYRYKGKRMRLETILQRQCYRLAGEFCGKSSYRPYTFKW
jgi:CRISPR-associated protein Cas1